MEKKMGTKTKRDKLIKLFFGNRKLRKRNKMANRSNLAFWDETGDPYKGVQRELLEMDCKSSSIETHRIWLDRVSVMEVDFANGRYDFENSEESRRYKMKRDAIKSVLKRGE